MAELRVLRANWVGSAGGPDELPQTVPEVAVCGRSNVGKSSLINAICGRKDLARTSSTPRSRTQLLLFGGNPGGYQSSLADTWSFDEGERIDAALFRRRIDQALAMRARLAIASDACAGMTRAPRRERTCTRSPSGEIACARTPDPPAAR